MPGMMSKASSRFQDIYDSLPEDGQSAVTTSLIALLDEIPSHLAEKAILSALETKFRYSKSSVPDLKSKKQEIESLLDQLSRDNKQSLVNPDRSIMTELLTEAVDSLVSWLNDIWRVVYEDYAYYELAHQCLLFCAESLVKLCELRGSGCKCSLMSIPINLTIKSSSGKLVSSFSLMGLPHLDQVLLWVWRDLFVSMLENREKSAKKRIPEMLTEIEGILTWQALEWLLYGGKRSLSDGSDEGFFPPNMFPFGLDYCHEDEGLPDEDSADEEGKYTRCSCNLHSPHWSSQINSRRHDLREMVQSHLFSVFRATPSLDLFTTIKTIAPDMDEATEELYWILNDVRAHSQENLSSAMEIYADEGEADIIMDVLDEYEHLLRPCDASIYQKAVSTLISEDEYEQRALEIVEQELMDTVKAVKSAVRATFSGVEVKENKDELEEIMKLRHGSTQRQTRVQAWVENVITPTSSPSNPMQFVAMMMGMPLPPSAMDGEESEDPFVYMDVNDPDLVELREECRPQLKERFTGWVDVIHGMGAGGGVKGKSGVCMRVFKKAVEVMPFLRCGDVVDEMIESLSGNPSKTHVGDALEALSSFCKLQRKTILMRNEKAKRNKAKAQQQQASSSSSPSKVQSSSTTRPSSSLNGNGRGQRVRDDSSNRSDSPPPLIPIDPISSSSGGSVPGAGTGAVSSTTLGYILGSGIWSESAPAQGQEQVRLPVYIPGGIEDVD